jgi:hypothetical protein
MTKQTKQGEKKGTKQKKEKEVKTHPYVAIYFRYPSTHEQIKSQPGNYVRGDDYKLYKLWLS